MRRLVVFGDSFVEGFRNGNAHGKPPTVTDLNFPYFLGEELGCEVINLGHHGHSNLAIANDVMSFVRRKSDDELKDYAFLICFSDWLRGTERNPEVKSTEVDNTLKGVPWSRWPDMPSPDESMLRIQTEMSYLGLKQLCQNHNIPYRMINSYDHQMFIDRLETYTCHYAPSGAVVDDRTGSKDWPFYNPTGDRHWIESKNLFNTLVDIIVETWLEEGEKDAPYSFIKYHRTKLYNRRYLTGCTHPNIAGNKLIAKTLAPYLKPIIG